MSSILPMRKGPNPPNNYLQKKFWYTPLPPLAHFGPLATGLSRVMHFIVLLPNWYHSLSSFSNVMVPMHQTVQLRERRRIDRQTERRTARVTVTTSYCAPSWTEQITNMQNRLMHRIVSTKLHSTLRKCTIWKTVRNYMSVPMCTTCVCSLSTYFWTPGLVCALCTKKCLFCACSMWTTQKWKMLGHRSPCEPWCTMQ